MAQLTPPPVQAPVEEEKETPRQRKLRTLTAGLAGKGFTDIELRTIITKRREERRRLVLEPLAPHEFNIPAPPDDYTPAAGPRALEAVTGGITKGVISPLGESVVKPVAKGTVETFKDPKELTRFVTTSAGAQVGSMLPIPPQYGGRITGALIGAAGSALATETGIMAYESAQGRPEANPMWRAGWRTALEASPEIGQAAFRLLKGGGKTTLAAAANKAGKIAGPRRPYVTPQGEHAFDILGEENLSANHLVNSIWMDLAYGLADTGWFSHGITQRARTRLAERAMTLAEQGMAETAGAVPTVLNREAADLWRGVVRHRFASDVIENRAGWEAWKGSSRGVNLVIPAVVEGGEDTVISVAALQLQRSELWRQARKLQLDPGSAAQHQRVVRRAANVDTKIEKAFRDAGDTGGFEEWRRLTNDAREIAQEFRNKTVDYIRTKAPPDEMLDLLLKPERLKTETATTSGLLTRDMIESMAGGDVLTAEQMRYYGKESLSPAELINLVKRASGGEREWDTVRATAGLKLMLDTLQDIGQPPQMVNGGAILRSLGKLGGVARGEIGRELGTEPIDTFKTTAAYALWGPDGLQRMRDLGFALAATERKSGGLGGVFLALATPSSISTLTKGGLNILALGALGSTMGAIPGAALVLVGPVLIAHSITNPKLYRYMIRFAREVDPIKKLDIGRAWAQAFEKQPINQKYVDITRATFMLMAHRAFLGEEQGQLATSPVQDAPRTGRPFGMLTPPPPGGGF